MPITLIEPNFRPNQGREAINANFLLLDSNLNAHIGVQGNPHNTQAHQIPYTNTVYPTVTNVKLALDSIINSIQQIQSTVSDLTERVNTIETNLNNTIGALTALTSTVNNLSVTVAQIQADMQSRLDRTIKTLTLTGVTSGNTISGVWNLAKSFVLIKGEVNRPCRVRLYAKSAYRDADASRPLGTDPSGEHGLICDIAFPTGNLEIDFSPVIIGANLDTPISKDIYYNITNMDSVDGDITVSLSLIELER